MAHYHDHSQTNFGRAFAIGVALNVAFVLVEAFYGYLAHSLALVADAGHNLSDVLGLYWPGSEHSGAAPADTAPNLWLAALLDPGRADQRDRLARRGGRNCLGSDLSALAIPARWQAEP